MSNPETHSKKIEQLLSTYRHEHPFPHRPEHLDERALHTQRYRDDVLAHNQACCQWLQNQAQQLGIPIQIYRLSSGRRDGDSYLYDLTINGEETLRATHYKEGYEYALQHMENEDLYCEAGTHSPETGRDLRKDYNEIESNCASDGTYTPKYSYGPGPFTSEKREE
jgi:hypothetical protein